LPREPKIVVEARGREGGIKYELPISKANPRQLGIVAQIQELILQMISAEAE
jgi:hypothetical protein